MENAKPVAIIGAGFAGLTAANFLRENNIPFVLFESGSRIAGLATSFKDSEGFTYDFGAHFITNRLADAVGVASECRTVKHYGEAVWLKNKVYNYPFGLIKVPRMAGSWLLQHLRNGGKPDSAAAWFRKRYGPALANEIALPLLESWSGASPDELSPAIGEGLFGGSIFKTLYLKLAAKFTGRAVACGYNKEMPEKASVWHVYPEKGVFTLCEKLAEGMENFIELESPVDAIYVENGKVAAVRAKGDIKEVAAVISTAPVNILGKLVNGTNALRGVEKFRYRPMVFVNIRLKGRNLLPDTVVWFPEKKFFFFRLTEVPVSMPWLAPEGKTMITADLGCMKNDEIWNMDEQTLTGICLEKMISVIPDVKERFIGSSILKTTIVYPVFLNSYESERRSFENSTNIENLISIGRNGEFSHMFMEDVYWRTQKKVSDLVASLTKPPVFFNVPDEAYVESGS